MTWPERDLPEGRHRLLKEFVMTEIETKPRKRVLRPAVLAPVLGLAAAAAVAVPLVLGGGAPAHAVAKNPDGTLTITIEEARDPKGLEGTLRSMGVNAVVDYIPHGKRCAEQPRSASFLSQEEARNPADGKPFVVWPPKTSGWVIDPAAVKPGQTAVLEFSVSDDERVGGMWAGLSNGPVAACELIDSDEAPLGPPPGSGD